MRRFHLLSAVAGLVVGVVIAVAAVAWAQPTVTVAAKSPAGGEPSEAEVQALDANTFVSVKDHGASQTVIVYKVDDKGMARLTHKAKFFY